MAMVDVDDNSVEA